MVASRHLFGTGEPAYAVNRQGVIVAWNPAAARRFGYTEAEAVGRRCWKLLAGQDLFGNQYCCEGCPLREMAFRHQSVKGSELLFRTAANELKKFSVCTLVVYDSSGEEFLVHLCRAVGETTQHGVGTNCANQASANHRRGALSKREIEVLTLLSQGKGTAEAAAAMCISPATVRNHSQHILFKLHVHSRLAAINVGQKLGLI